MNQFPKWKYHATEPARVVHDEAAETALGDDWAESPADHQPASAEPAPVKRGRKPAGAE
jgi:hypothetical protein